MGLGQRPASPPPVPPKDRRFSQLLPSEIDMLFNAPEEGGRSRGGRHSPPPPARGIRATLRRWWARMNHRLAI